MNTIIVTPVEYKFENRKTYKYGIRILNRKLNMFTIIDCKTLQPIKGVYSVITLEESEENIKFNLKV